METRLLFVVVLLTVVASAVGKKAKDDAKPDWAKKDITDFNDADLERLLDQWEEDEEPLEPDELPEHLREAPKLDMSKVDMTNPENLLKLSKKGRTLMTFVTVSGSPSRQETDEITKIWQQSLMNNHVIAERYIIGDNRVIYMFKDGAQAWDAKDFLVEQERMEEMTIENKRYPGKFSEKQVKEEL